MELLLASIANLWPVTYTIGFAAVFFRVFTSMWGQCDYPDLSDVMTMFVYSLICGALWPGLIISKLAL